MRARSRWSKSISTAIPGTPRQYAVRGIPTLMLFKDGKVQATQVGAVGKAQLAAFVDGNI